MKRIENKAPPVASGSDAFGRRRREHELWLAGPFSVPFFGHVAVLLRVSLSTSSLSLSSTKYFLSFVQSHGQPAFFFPSTSPSPFLNSRNRRDEMTLQGPYYPPSSHFTHPTPTHPPTPNHRWPANHQHASPLFKVEEEEEEEIEEEEATPIQPQQEEEASST